MDKAAASPESWCMVSESNSEENEEFYSMFSMPPEQNKESFDKTDNKTSSPTQQCSTGSLKSFVHKQDVAWQHFDRVTEKNEEIDSEEMFGDGTKDVSKLFVNKLVPSDSVCSVNMFGSGQEVDEPDIPSPTPNNRLSSNVDSADMFGSDKPSLKEREDEQDVILSKSSSVRSSQLFGSGRSDSGMMSTEFEPSEDPDNIYDEPVNEEMFADQSRDVNMEPSNPRGDAACKKQATTTKGHQLYKPEMPKLDTQHTTSNNGTNYAPFKVNYQQHHVYNLPAGNVSSPSYQGFAPQAGGPYSPIQSQQYGALPMNTAYDPSRASCQVTATRPFRPFLASGYGGHQQFNQFYDSAMLGNFTGHAAGYQTTQDPTMQTQMIGSTNLPSTNYPQRQSLCRSLSEDAGKKRPIPVLRGNTREAVPHYKEQMNTGGEVIPDHTKGRPRSIAGPAKQVVGQQDNITKSEHVEDDLYEVIEPADKTVANDPDVDTVGGSLMLLDIAKDDKEEKLEEVKANATIKVTGLSESVNMENLELFFESKRKTGGGDIVKIDVNHKKREAIIEYMESKVMERVLEKQKEVGEFMHEGLKLHVTEYVAPPIDPYKVFVSGIPECCSKEGLENYLAVVSTLKLDGILYGETHDTAILKFAQEVDKSELQRGFERRSLEDCTLMAHQVEVTRSVKVKGVTLGSATDVLLLYFENKRRSNGGDVVTVEIHSNGEAYIVVFVNVEDAINVCQKKDHVLDGQSLSVCLYYPCLDRDPDAVPTLPVTLPDPLIIDLDMYMLRLLKGSQAYHQQIDQSMERVHGKVMWPVESSDKLTITCTVSVDADDARDIVTHWTERCQQVIAGVCEHLSVSQKITVAREVWPQLISRLRHMNISSPDYIALYANTEDASIVVVGNTNLVDTLESSIKEVVAELEEEMTAKEQSATKTKKLRIYQWALFHALRISQAFSGNSPLKLSLNAEEKSLTFTGPLKDVDEALSLVDKKLNSCPKRQVNEFSKMAFNLLFQEKTRRYVKKALEKQRVFGVWDNCRGTLYMYSKTENDTLTAISVIKSAIYQGNISLSSSSWRQLKSSDGQNLLDKLQKCYEGQFAFEIKPSDLTFVSTDDISDSIRQEIEDFFELHSIVKDTLAVDVGTMRYTVTHKKKELEQIEKQYGRLNVRIECGSDQFKVQGTRDGCKMTIKKLQDLVSDIRHCEQNVRAPGIRAFLMTDNGRRELQSIEMDSECILLVPLDSSLPKTRMFQCAKAQINDTKVLVIQEDILQLVVDAIVTPTSRKLTTSRGLAGAVFKAGGFSIQKECEDILKKHRKEPYPGDVVVTKGGSLACQHVLLAVIDQWKDGEEDEKFRFKSAIRACLKEAGKLQMKTLAFPVVGLGYFQYPSNKAVPWLLTEINKFLLDNRNSHCIETVYICDLQPEVSKTVVSEMKRLNPSTRDSNCGVLIRANSHHVEEPNSDPEEESEYEEMGVLRKKRESGGGGGERGGSFTAGQIKVSVVVGELVKQKVNILVNSTNQNLDLSVGALSKTFLAAGGERLRQECLRKYPDGIKLGDVAVTSGGDMKCEAIFHGTFVHWDGGKGHAEKIMSTFIYTCLDIANQKGANSIAFPALGTGVLKFPGDVVAHMMFKSVQMFARRNPQTSLQKVLLVVWQGDVATVKAFQAEEQRQQRHSDTQPDSPTSVYSSESRILAENLYASLPDYQTSDSVGPFNVQIIQGDITTVKTDGVVNSVLKELNLSYGTVSRAILQAAGVGIQSECNTPDMKEKIVKDGLVVTSAGRMFCRKIIHMRARSKRDGWKESIVKVLEEAEFYGLKSLAFPAIGAGAQGNRPETMARILMESIKEYGNSSTYRSILKTIRIVIYETDMLQKFIDGSKSEGTSGPHLPFFKKKKQEDRAVESVIVHIYSSSEFQKDNAKDKLLKLYQNKTLQKPLTLWEKVTDLQRTKLQGMAKNKGVKITLDKKKPDMMISLQGFSKALSEASQNIQAYLRNIERDLKMAELKGEVKLPANWARMKMTDVPVNVPLPAIDKEYLMVAKYFQNDFPQGRIHQIQRIQNPALYIRYIGKKHEMDRENKLKNNERILWHGTKPNAVPNINTKGFDRNYNSGASHGAGVYFAASAATSANGYCHADAAGLKYIYMAEVLTGEYCVGTPNIRLPPQKPGVSGMARFDSTTDNLAAPNFFVIFHDDQAYPTYLVTFR